MLYSKANLEVVRAASKNPADDSLCGVRLEPDGSTAAGNGRMLMAVAPVPVEKVHWPKAAGEMLVPGSYGMVLGPDLVNKALKNIPKDKRVSLQMAGLTRVLDPGRVGLTSIDAQGDPTTVASMPMTARYPDWRGAVRQIRGTSAAAMVCVSRADLRALLDAVDAACPGGGDQPLFLELGSGGRGLLARAVSLGTGQRVVGAIVALNTGGAIPPPNAWEQAVFGMQVGVPRKAIKLLVKKEEAT